MEQEVLNPTLEKMVALVDELQVLDRIVAKQKMGRIVVKHRIAVDNNESGLNKMENWQLKQSDPNTFILLNELHWHELHVALDVHTIPGSTMAPYWKGPLSTESTSNFPFGLTLMYNSIIRLPMNARAKRLFRNEKVWVEMHKGIAWDKVENPNPQSTPLVLPSFKEYTPPMTHLKEVEETIGILMEVESLHEPQLEDLGLNTCNHDIPLSSREVLSLDEPKPQPQPLPNCPPLDVNLGDKRGTDPPIKPHSLDSFMLKVVDKSTIITPPSPNMASFHPKDIYCYYHPCVDDPKKHYGQGGSLGTDISKITRKQSKTGKHGHENQKSTKRSQRIKAEAKKVKLQSTWSTAINHYKTKPHNNPIPVLQVSQKAKNTPSYLNGP
ncbi:hypothetical protein Tco_1213540 [Tanacetum coccineum]